MTLRERMKNDRDLRHKARRKLRVKAGNGSGERTAEMQKKYKERRARTQYLIEKFRKQNLVKVK